MKGNQRPRWGVGEVLKTGFSGVDRQSRYRQSGFNPDSGAALLPVGHIEEPDWWKNECQLPAARPPLRRRIAHGRQIHEHFTASGSENRSRRTGMTTSIPSRPYLRADGCIDRSARKSVVIQVSERSKIVGDDDTTSPPASFPHQIPPENRFHSGRIRTVASVSEATSIYVSSKSNHQRPHYDLTPLRCLYIFCCACCEGDVPRLSANRVWSDAADILTSGVLFLVGVQDFASFDQLTASPLQDLRTVRPLRMNYLPFFDASSVLLAP